MDTADDSWVVGMDAVMYELHCVVNFARMNWYLHVIEKHGYTDDKDAREAEFDKAIANNPQVTLSSPACI